MRDYPSVPNVFRVASTHSINSENPYNNAKNLKVISNQNNSNSNTKSQESQPKPLAMHQLTTSASIERSNSTQHQQQQQQQPQKQLQPQQSPYATLPRGQRFVSQPHQQTGVINTISGSIPATGFGSMAGSFSDLQLNNIGNNRRQQQQQRQVTGFGNYKTPNELQHQQQQQQKQQQQQIQLQHQQQQQQHILRQQQHHLGGGIVGMPDHQGGISNMVNTSGGYLWLLTPVAASISVAIVIAALAGPQWLFTEEKLPNSNYNGTANFNALDDGAYITKYTKSSLWILCTTLPGLDVDSYNCIKIDYFPKEGYQPDPHDSTPAIPYTVTKSCPIFLAAGVFLVISFIVFLIPTCSHQNNLYYFSAGILFIVSGLVMLIGLIAYISILKAEIGSKLRPRSTLQPALFKVTYGQSFFLFVCGFIVTEFRLPCFSVANIQAKFKEGANQHPLSQSYKRYKQPGTLGSQDGLQRPRPRGDNLQNSSRNANTHHPQQSQSQPGSRIVRSGGNPRQHQVHDARTRPPGHHPGSYGHPGQTQTLPGACRKHPNAGSNLNLYLHNDLDRRFYFEKPAVSKCNLHSRSFAKSLNELCTEAAPPPPPPAPPATTTAPAPSLFADLPQEFPLTRSVSTTTEIYTAPVGSGTSAAPQTGQLKRKQQRNMATNTSGVQLEDQSRLGGLKRGLRKTKDELFQEFCRRAGMRSKPKNIYYISGSEGAGEEGEDEGRAVEMERRENAGHATDPEVLDDDDEDGDDHGFRQFRLEEDQLYVVGDHAQLVVPRRSSMGLDPLGQPLRRLNSNLSLHTEQGAGTGIAGGAWPQMQRMPFPPPPSTLPRCFLRQSSDSLQSGGYNTLSSSQQRFSQLMLQHQQQLQQQNRYLSTLTLPGAGGTGSGGGVVGGGQVPPKSQVQWPVAIPSSPSNYSNGYQQHPQPIYPGGGGGGAGSVLGSAAGASSASTSHPAKFQRAYAFDDPQRRSSYVSDAFDLDEIERERRRSHASLFGLSQGRDPYDLINGTAV